MSQASVRSVSGGLRRRIIVYCSVVRLQESLR